jgi:hypothetical protein
MEGSCSTGQSPQTAVVPGEEEEEKEGRRRRKIKRTRRKIMERDQGDSWRSQRLEALHGRPMLHKRVKGLDDDDDDDEIW